MKDPAVLFYTSDFITGTLTMTDAQRGKYIILLCLQHQQGYLTEDDMLNICNEYDEKIFSKFEKDVLGYYYNKRMLLESEKRNKYTESRRANRNQLNNNSLYIYIIHDPDKNLYKIGSSVNPERRLLELKSSNPNLSLEYSFGKTSQDTETFLHKKYKERRKFNEWYELDKDELNEIKSYMTNDMNTHMNKHMENENEDINKEKREELLKKREESFRNEVLSVEKYPKEMLINFCNYWTEPNKSRTKMKWELEKTFEISRRLATWAGNDRKFNGEKQETHEPVVLLRKPITNDTI